MTILPRGWVAAITSCVLTAIAVTNAQAQSFTILDGQTVNVQQTVGPGGTGLIEALGNLNVAAATAVTNAGDNVTVNNAGTIVSGNAFGLDGIDIANSSMVFNSGTITAPRYSIQIIANNTVVNTGTLNALTGIFANGDNNTITNSGIINATCCGINIVNNSMVTNSGTITSTGGDGIAGEDGNTIVNSGTIDANVDALYLEDNNTITNSGSLISQTEDGIDVVDNNRITNTGTITAFEDGIFAFDNNIIVNSGTIVARDDEGIDAGDGNTITNSGNIVSNDDGINVLNNNTITNSGTITAQDDGLDVRNNNTITNSGTIRSLGDDGVDIEGTGVTLTNTGSIFGFETAIDSDVSGTTIINSGKLFNSNGPTGIAIEYGGVGVDRLVLLNGSLIVGRIVYDDGGGNDTVEFRMGTGRSFDYTFEPLPANLIFDTPTENTIVDRANNRVIFVDPTGFSTNSVLFDSISRSIFDTLDGATGGSGETGGSGGTGSTNSYFLQTGEAASSVDQPAYRAWISGFASASEQPSQGANSESNNRLTGVLLGLDADISSQVRIGLFGGVVDGRTDAQNSRQSTNTVVRYVGAYSNWSNDDYFGSLAVIGGFSQQDSIREVANNLVENGLETASAEYAGFTLSPALTIGRRLLDFDDGRKLLGSVRLRYSGTWFNGYTETGVVNPVTVNDWETHRLGVRAQLSMPQELPVTDGGSLRLDPRLGVEVGRGAGGDVSATVGGQPLNFGAQYDDEEVAGFLGLDVIRVLPNDAGAFKLGGEVRKVAGGLFELRGQGSFKFKF